MNARYAQQGFSLITAVLLITVIAAIAAVMTSTLGARAVSTTHAQRGTQAYYAARSGLEYAIERALNGGCAVVTTPLTIEGYDVTIACASAPVTSDGPSYTVYDLTVTAAQGQVEDSSLVSRTVRATVSTL